MPELTRRYVDGSRPLDRVAAGDVLVIATGPTAGRVVDQDGTQVGRVFPGDEVVVLDPSTRRVANNRGLFLLVASSASQGLVAVSSLVVPTGEPHLSHENRAVDLIRGGLQDGLPLRVVGVGTVISPRVASCHSLPGLRGSKADIVLSQNVYSSSVGDSIFLSHKKSAPSGFRHYSGLGDLRGVEEVEDFLADVAGAETGAMYRRVEQDGLAGMAVFGSSYGLSRNSPDAVSAVVFGDPTIHADASGTAVLFEQVIPYARHDMLVGGLTPVLYAIPTRDRGRGFVIDGTRRSGLRCGVAPLALMSGRRARRI
jgi:hypothetical protein